MPSVAEALNLGVRYQQAGRLAEAEQIYRQVLAVEPGHAQALHLLGLTAAQSGHLAAAIDLLQQAIRADRNQPAFHANLGEALRQAGRLAEAEVALQHSLKLAPQAAQTHVQLASVLRATGRSELALDELREALKLKPDDAAARTLLGQLAWELGRTTDAEACFRRVVRDQPGSAAAHYQLGAFLHDRQQPAEAETCYRAALNLQPNHAAAWNNLGTLCKDQSQWGEAEQCFRRAITAQSNYDPALANLGLLLESQGHLAEAAASYRAALAANPQALLAAHSLAAVLQKQGDSAGAAEFYATALRINPRHTVSRLGLAMALEQCGQLEQAVAQWEQVVAEDPACADAYNNLSVGWNELGDRQRAVACSRQAIALQPAHQAARVNLVVTLLGAGQLDDAVDAAHDALRRGISNADVYGNLANCHQTRGELDLALDAHRQAVAADPSHPQQFSNLLYTLNYHPGVTLQQRFDEHRQWGLCHADPLTAAAPPHANDRSPERRLRIGCVSGHFRTHAVNAFAEPILASHDHATCEIFCYANGPLRDETTQRLQGYADHWRDITGLSDAAACEAIRGDRIDILVDLAGHIAGNRLQLFARKPAPVQVTYLGYQSTTGMAAMDYRLTDAHTDPPGLTDAFHTERLVRLPRTFFVYQPSAQAPALGELPARQNGYVTFGSFNHFAKVTPQVLDVWAQVLAAVPHSRLRLLTHPSAVIRDRVVAIMATHGVAADRVELVTRRPYLAYLELISSVDVALDTFPFNGHTTTCDCLWQGVPVVALVGDCYAARFGSSGLVALGLDQLVASTPDQYVDIATQLAADLAALSEMRNSMRKRVEQSPLMDYVAFARALENEYRQMWRAWCGAAAPARPSAELRG